LSPVQAACWLDLKRSYMEMRPNLRRVIAGEPVGTTVTA